MQIKIFGKVRRKGVSKKSGNPYDFYEIHYVAPARGVIGEAAKTVTMDANLFPFDDIVPGIYSMEFDDTGSPVALKPIQVAPNK